MNYCLFINKPVCLFTYKPVCLFVYIQTSLFVCLQTNYSVCQQQKCNNTELPINQNLSAGHVLFFSSTKSNLAVFRQDKFQFSRTKQDKKFFAAFGKKTSQFSSFLQYRGQFYIVGSSNPGFFRKK